MTTTQNLLRQARGEAKRVLKRVPVLVRLRRAVRRAPAPVPARRPASPPAPGESVVRPALGLAKVPALPADTEWQQPAGITGSGHRVRTLYSTGSRPTVYDADLLDKLNAEYVNQPIVPKPPSYEPEALAIAAKRRVTWVHNMVGLAGQRTLEIGCGNGFEVWSLAHNLGADAHGVDVAHYVPWDQLAGPRVHFECADLSVQNPYEPSSFDRILSFTVWEHVTHPYAMLKAVHDLLKPGGTAWIRANLFAGPQASHRYRDIFFPWPHLLFSDDVVRAWDVANGRAPLTPERIEILAAAGVNRLSWLHYEYYADQLGFDIMHRQFTTAAIDEDFYLRFEDVLGRYPRTDLSRDYLLMVLRKPA